MSNSLWPHGLYSPRNSPGQNTGAGSRSLLGIFPTQGLSRASLHCRWILYQLSYQGSPSLTWRISIISRSSFHVPCRHKRFLDIWVGKILGILWFIFMLCGCVSDFFFNCFGLILVHYLSLFFYPNLWKSVVRTKDRSCIILASKFLWAAFFFCCPHETFKTHPGVFGFFIGKRKGSYLSAGGLQGGKNKIASVWRE